MKKLLGSLFLTLLTMTAFAADLSYNGVTPDVIIDVRSPGEFASGHVDGAVNIPVELVEQGIHSLKGIKANSKILVYCRSGRRSAAATAILKQQGYSNVLDGGGMETLVQSLKKCSSSPC